MQTTGELTKDKILITKKKDIGRLSQRSRFGKQVKDDVLEISLLEALFLIDEGKLKVTKDKKRISFEEIIIEAAKLEKNIDLKYLVYKDLRSRGKIIKIDKNKNDFYCLENGKKIFSINVFSEKDLVDFNKILDLIDQAENEKVELFFSVVDEEGDITYYASEKINLQGLIPSIDSLHLKGTVFDNCVIIFDEKNSKKLFEKGFYGKPYSSGLQISFIEALYLINKKILTLENMKNKEFKEYVKKYQENITELLEVYKDLKKKGLIVKTGFKFGVHFRAYTDKPGKTHAEYMIQLLKQNQNIIWSDISRAVRLSHTVNKNLVFSHYTNNFDYISVKRIRP
jgi:tRNA-intron endonuclease, archaea type